MPITQQAITATRKKPDAAPWEKSGGRARFSAAIDEARAQLDRGEGIPHEEAKRQMMSWFTKH